MKFRARLSAIALILALFVAAPVALADTTPATTITQLTVLEPSDEKYTLYHGVLWLEFDKARNNYRWGGKHCNGDDLSEETVGMLFSAFRGKQNIRIRYKNNSYSGKTYRCVTGFTVSR